jgi:hypothetical protein
MRYDTCVHGHGWRAWDVARLFTNIDQTDLITRINDLPRRAWQQQLPTFNASRAAQGTMATTQTMVLQVFADRSSPAWHASLNHAYHVYGNPGQAGVVSRGRMNNDRAGFDSTRGSFHLMTLHEAQTLSALLIQHAYVRFEDYVYHQTTGIPMGINPAVYYANFYLLIIITPCKPYLSASAIFTCCLLNWSSWSNSSRCYAWDVTYLRCLCTLPL